MDDDFFDNQNNAGANSPSAHQHQQAQSDAHYDDFFGSGQPHIVDESASAHNQQPVFHEEPADDFFGNQSHHNQQQTVQNSYASYGETATATGYGHETLSSGFQPVESVPYQLTEQDERRQRLQKEEQERTSRLIQKQNEEYSLKSTKLSNAKQFLQSWKSEREQMNLKRKQVCLQEEEVAIEARTKVTYRNPWEKVTDNISLKASEHPGEKDVTRMRESILNKKSDLLNAKN